MPRVTEETLVNVNISVTREARTRTNPDGSTTELELDVLGFADRNGPDIRLVRVPLDENGKAELIRQLTGGIVVATEADVPKVVLPS